MSQGDITRLNVMYKCQMTKPESQNQDKEIHENTPDNSVPRYKRPAQILYKPDLPSELEFNNNLNLMIQHGRYRQPSEVLMNNNNMNTVHQNVQQIQPSEIPTNSNVYQPGQQTQEIPNNSNLITDNQPRQQIQTNKNVYEQKGSALASSNLPVQEAKSSQLPVKNTQSNGIEKAAAEKSEKPCGSNIFMTFLFKIRP